MVNVKDKSKYFKIIANFTSAAIRKENNNIDVTINSMLSSISEVIEVEHALYFVAANDGRKLEKRFERCYLSQNCDKTGIERLFSRPFSWWLHKFESMEPLVISDLSEMPLSASEERQLLKQCGVKSLLVVPITERGVLKGALGVESFSRSIDWREESINLLKILSNIVSDLKIREQNEREIERMAQMQEILLNIAKIYINAPLDKLKGVIISSLRDMALFVGADRSYIFNYDFTNGQTSNTLEWCRSGIEPQIKQLQKLQLETLPEWVALHKKGDSFICADISQLPYDGPYGVRGLLEPQNVKSIITVPMMDGSSCIGFVGFDWVNSYHTHSSKEQSLLQFFAQIVVNVNKRMEFEESLNRSKELAEKANQEKSNFLTNMSHEIRTPLNSVIGFTELLTKTPLNVSQKKFAQSVNLSAQTLMEIINDVLDLSKIEAGKLELSLLKSDIVELCEYVCDIVKYLAIEKKIELLLNIAPSIPRFAKIDPIRLKQVLVNLLNNAIKFTHKGEVELKLSFSESGEDKGIYQFEVRDTGIGISLDDQKKLFKSFSQIDSSTTRKYGGSGLGLVISNHIVNQMGGAIEVESAPNKGAKFSFAIEVEVDTTILNYNANDLNISRALIIDDNSNNRLILEHALSSWGIESVSCEDGYSAIREIKLSPPFDVIIIDYRMPLINGIDTIRLLRNDSVFTGRREPVIIMSTSDNDAKIDKELKEGGLLYQITKPVKMRDLYNYLLNLSKTGEFPQPEESQSNSESDTSSNSEGENNPSPVILVAEDVDMNLLLLRTLIKGYLPNAIIYEANNGVEAIEIYKKHAPSIIFMDMQMPIMDGITATKEIRKLEKKGQHAIIIALTASATSEDREKSIKAGMDYYLTKPINQRELKNILLGSIKESTNHSIVGANRAEDYHQVNNTPPLDPTKHFNREEMLSRVDGEEELLEELFETLNYEMEESLSQLESDLLNSRIDQAKQNAHKIKGVALNMSFNQLSHVAQELEKALKADRSQIPKLYSQLKEEWKIVKSIIYKN